MTDWTKGDGGSFWADAHETRRSVEEMDGAFFCAMIRAGYRPRNGAIVIGRLAATEVPAPEWRVKNDWQRIVAEAADEHGVSPFHVAGRSRSRKAVAAKYQAYYNTWALPGASLSIVGGWFGRHPSSVLAGAKAHATKHNLPLPPVGKAVHKAVDGE